MVLINLTLPYALESNGRGCDTIEQISSVDLNLETIKTFSNN